MAIKNRGGKSWLMKPSHTFSASVAFLASRRQPGVRAVQSVSISQELRTNREKIGKQIGETIGETLGNVWKTLMKHMETWTNYGKHGKKTWGNIGDKP